MHRNATASTLTSFVTGLLLYLADRLGFHGFTTEDAVAIVGAANAVVLWIGKRGVKAAAVSLWKGQAKTDETTSPAA